MKIIIAAILCSVFAVSGYCAQPNKIGNVSATKLAIDSKTLAQINALTPDTTNQLVVCSDCEFVLCISTGADSLARGGFVVIGSTVPAATSLGAAGVPMHCQ